VRGVAGLSCLGAALPLAASAAAVRDAVYVCLVQQRGGRTGVVGSEGNSSQRVNATKARVTTGMGRHEGSGEPTDATSSRRSTWLGNRSA